MSARRPAPLPNGTGSVQGRLEPFVEMLVEILASTSESEAQVLTDAIGAFAAVATNRASSWSGADK